MAQKSMFQEGRMGKLQKDLQEISDDTNYLRTKTQGFLNEMDGELYSRVSGQAQLAQSQINRLADDSEQLKNFVRLAITKIQGAELQNVADAIALMKGSARVESWGNPPQEKALPMIGRDTWNSWGSFSTQLLKGSSKWYTTTAIPPFLFGTFRGLTLQLERTTLIDRMLKYKGDAEIAALLEMMQHGSIQEQMEAEQKLDKISDTLIEVGRNQAAYEIYRQFGQTSYMEFAHAEAEKARALLSELGVSKTFYDENVKLTSEYTGTSLSACLYNPLKHDYSILPTDDRLLTMIRLSMGDREYREWAKENYDDFVIEIREEDRLEKENSHPKKLPDGTDITTNNSRNETTLDYFLKHVMKDPDNVDILRNPDLEYQDWLNKTYGETESDLIEAIEGIGLGISEGVISLVDGVVEAVKHPIDTVISVGLMAGNSPQAKEFQRQVIINTSAQIANSYIRDVTNGGTKSRFKFFSRGTFEVVSAIGGPKGLKQMLGVMKVTKAVKVTAEVAEVAKVAEAVETVTSVAEKVKKFKYPASVSRLPESFASKLPLQMVKTPEGFKMIVPNTGKMEFGPSKPPTIHDGPSVAKVEGKIEGTGQGLELYRRTANVGEFSHLEVPMQLREVKRLAEQAGVGLDGVKIKIIRDPEMLDVPFAGWANPNGKEIQLYPNAFINEEQLIKTLAHERTHIFQVRIYGHAADDSMLRLFEDGAYGIEDTFWDYFKKKGN
ncbi:hypothetical protein [Paenibacillus sp. FSL K6-2524]